MIEATQAPPRTRYELIKDIREEGEKSEQTEILIDHIQELWETIDLLHERFGPARAQRIITAPGSLGEEYPNNDD